jgi:hypothetical protein
VVSPDPAAGAAPQTKSPRPEFALPLFHPFPFLGSDAKGGSQGAPHSRSEAVAPEMFATFFTELKQAGLTLMEAMDKDERAACGAMTKLALAHSVEQSRPQEFDYRLRPREKALEMLEQRAGPKARKMFERFLARIDKLERSEEEVGTAQIYWLLLPFCHPEHVIVHNLTR